MNENQCMIQTGLIILVRQVHSNLNLNFPREIAHFSTIFFITVSNIYNFCRICQMITRVTLFFLLFFSALSFLLLLVSWWLFFLNPHEDSRFSLGSSIIFTLTIGINKWINKYKYVCFKYIRNWQGYTMKIR